MKNSLSPSPTRIFWPSDETVSVLGYLDLPFMIKNKAFQIKMFVVENLQTPVLLGISFLAKYNTVINFSDNTITIDDELRFRIKESWINKISTTINQTNDRLIMTGTFFLPPKQKQIIPLNIHNAHKIYLITPLHLSEKGVTTKIFHSNDAIHLAIKIHRNITQKLYPNTR